MMGYNDRLSVQLLCVAMGDGNIADWAVTLWNVCEYKCVDHPILLKLKIYLRVAIVMCKVCILALELCLKWNCAACGAWRVMATFTGWQLTQSFDCVMLVQSTKLPC